MCRLPRSKYAPYGSWKSGTMSTHPLIREIENSFRRDNIPDFRPGDSVRVHTLIKEGDKERVQVFEGVVIDRRSGTSLASFTVRKISYGVGVRARVPLHSSRIEKIEVVQRGRVRRARLNYLRKLQGKAARIKGERIQVSASETAATVEAPRASRRSVGLVRARAEAAG
jgi:large subunit ribosomal protein L19